MAKYGKKASQKVGRAMHERKRGTLKSGSGRKVTSRKQAIAIGLSEAREAGGKVPPRKGAGRKSSERKTAGRKTSTRKSTGRKSASRKSSTGRKSTARKSSSRSSAKKR